MLEELSTKELIRKTRLEIRELIRNTEKAIKENEALCRTLRADLMKAKTLDGGVMLQIFENSLRGVEDKLSKLKAQHSRYIAAQSLPSAAYPNGIRFEQFSL